MTAKTPRKPPLLSSKYEKVQISAFRPTRAGMKKVEFLNDRRSLSKTHTYSFWPIYDGYNYGKKIGKTCAYGELMSLEDTPLKPIYLYVDFARLSNHFIFQIH